MHVGSDNNSALRVDGRRLPVHSPRAQKLAFEREGDAVVRSYGTIAGLVCAVLASGAAPAAAQCTKAKVKPVAETWTATKTKSNKAEITVFTGPTDHGNQLQIATGLGKYVWVAQQGDSTIMKLALNGKAELYATPTANSAPEAIAANGNMMWFAEWAAPCVASINKSGTITEYNTGLSQTQSTGMTTGPNGTVWFGTDNSGIGSITAKGGIKLYNFADQYNQITGITLGPDGNIWFIEFDGNNIGKITPSGAVTEYNAKLNNSYSLGIAAGGDERMWFADDNSSAPKIGAINTDGTGLTYYSTGLSGPPIAIVEGPDGNLYFGETGPTIGRITTKGVITEYPLPVTEGSFPVVSLAVGPDGNIWFTNGAHSQVGMVKLPIK
jgi:streptogramin lyase